MIGLMEKELDGLPPNIKRVIDMAGGAGDLGLALSMELLIRQKELDETDIVDPVEDLAIFNRLIVEELPDSRRFKKS